MNMRHQTPTIFIIFLIALLATPMLLARTVNDEFAPAINGSVLAVAVDQHGLPLVAGQFTQINGLQRTRFARLRIDGSVDPDFQASISDGSVSSFKELDDGSIVICGDFTNIGGMGRPRLAKLSASGVPDYTFAPSPNSNVFAIDITPSDATTPGIYIAGQFSQINGLNRPRVARLNIDGTLDPAFLPASITGIARSMAVQSDGNILLGGEIQVSGAPGNRLFRLLSNGLRDTSFSVDIATTSALPATVRAIRVLPDGKILIGGAFETIDGQPRTNLARLLQNGSLDTDFVPVTLNGPVFSLQAQPDGRVVVGGEFTGVSLRSGLIRLNENGSLDSSFATLLNPDQPVYTAALQSDGAVLFGGAFIAITGVARQHLSRIDPYGMLEQRFDPTVLGGAIESIALQADGRIILGGPFNTVNATTRNRIARLLGNGSLDNGFVPLVNDTIRSIAIQSDRKILIGGDFTEVNGSARIGLARLLPNGGTDPGFSAQIASGSVYSIDLQPDGKVLIGGDFNTIGGQSRDRVARLNTDGSLDTGFIPMPDKHFDRIRVVRIQPDGLFMQPNGRVLIGGDYTITGPLDANQIERLNADGSKDSSFVRGVSNTVWALFVPPVAIVYAAGDFSFNFLGGWVSMSSTGVPSGFQANPDSRADTFVLLHGGSGLGGGGFTTLGSSPHRGFGMVQPSGAAVTDYTMDIAGGQSRVTSIVVQPDGKPLIAGSFTSVDGKPRQRMARIGAYEPAVQTMTWEPDLQRLSWFRSGSQPIPSLRPQLLIATTCCSANQFVPVNDGGSMQSFFNDGWYYNGFVPPKGVFYLRWRMQFSDARSSISQTESPIYRFVNPAIIDAVFANGFE